MKPTLENMEELLNAACNSGGSGQGISHYANANKCGMRAHLALLRSEEDKSQGTQRSVMAEKTDARRMGSAYHQFQQWWSEGALDNLPGFMALQFEDPNFTVALKLFEFYVQNYGPRYWGKMIKNEWLLPESEEARLKNIMTFGGVTFNAKPDRVTEITEADLADIDRCELDGPGVYVIDFKTAGVDHVDEYWQLQSQALWYPLAVQMERPDWNVKGTIFDVIRKPRGKNQAPWFEAHYVPMDKRALQKLYPFVRQGAQKIKEAKDAQWGNVSECVSFSFGGDNVCPFYGAECALTRESA